MRTQPLFLTSVLGSALAACACSAAPPATPPAAKPAVPPPSAAPAAPAVELIGTAALPGSTADLSGLKDPMAGGAPANLVGSFGSGMTYTGKDDLYLAVSDRGPGDGGADFPDRYHVLRVKVVPGDPAPVRVQVVETHLLKDAQGRAFTGSAAALNAADQPASMRLDPEAIALGPTNTIWTADEYGPWLDEWTREGAHMRRVQMPERYRVAAPAPTPDGELPPHNTRGRQPNRGLEGMAISPDGSRMYTLLQGPLIQDGALNQRNKRVGRNVRMLELKFNEQGVPVPQREFVYQLADPAFGLNELAALPDGSFLVIEKDGEAGAKARTKKVVRIETAGATDISAVDALPSGDLPSEIVPVKKSVLLDLTDPRFGLAGASMPEKVEGLAVGPRLPDGRVLLLVASDNDYVATAPSFVWAFAVQPTALGMAAAPSATSAAAGQSAPGAAPR